MENCQAMSNMLICAYAAQWHGISTQQITGSLIKLSSCIQPILLKRQSVSLTIMLAAKVIESRISSQIKELRHDYSALNKIPVLL